MLRRFSALAFLALVVAPAASAADAPSTTFDAVLPHYEAVRLALVDDSLAGVTAAAAEIRRELEGLAADPSAERAGVAETELAAVEKLLPEAVAAATALADAGDLAAARDALYALTQPLVRWRHAIGDGPTVAYCAMAKRSWLQVDDAAIGNPYYGSAMPACGEVVG